MPCFVLLQRRRLEDKYLFMSAFTLMIPVVLVLIVWNSVSFYRFMSVLIPRNAVSLCAVHA